MKIEKNDLIQIYMEVYLFLTKTSFEWLQITITKWIILQKDLQVTACKTHNIYKIKKIENNMKCIFKQTCYDGRLQVFLEITNKQFFGVYENLVKKLQQLEKSFLWVQMMVIFNTLLTKQGLNELTSSNNFWVNSRQICKQYQNKGILIQMNHKNDQAFILLKNVQDQMSDVRSLSMKDDPSKEQQKMQRISTKYDYTVEDVLVTFTMLEGRNIQTQFLV
ncbi:unnamed protein product [Paramecium primaurelia]|uniref:Uncharacterized protein n=1 Tax=Paramecium primaurelia TaxID=5886 RepID=A0A8S1QNF2_PARPR|nr:unnamed protein product [Paramecium primaurelia]